VEAEITPLLCRLKLMHTCRTLVLSSKGTQYQKQRGWCQYDNHDHGDPDERLRQSLTTLTWRVSFDTILASTNWYN